MTAVRPAVGDRLEPLVRAPSRAQLFLFSAATWNAHRIHYDRPYAESEGYPDVLVQSHLHACFLLEAVRAAFGPVRVRRFGWQNRGPAVPGDELTVTGEVTAVAERDGGLEVELALEERNQRDELCVNGWSTVVLGP